MTDTKTDNTLDNTFDDLTEEDKKAIDESIADGFLPNNYNVPSSDGNYMKFNKGENKFRILQSPILGYELWIDKKPKRYPMNVSIPVEEFESADIDESTGEPRPAKHFWAMAVYNYAVKRVQVLELTQKRIMVTIKGLTKSPEWGSPLGYDLSVVKEGDGFNTTYELIPSPPKALSEEVKTAWDAVKDKIKVNALFEGGNPFAE